MLRSELDALADVGAVEVRHVLERPTNSLLAAKGRITPSLVLEIATPRPGADYFVCGPEPMMNLVCTALAQASVPEEQIYTERFVVAKRENDTAVNEGRTHAVRFSRSGRLVNIQEGQTILEGALAAGLQLPFSCTMGGCAACKLRVEGKVHLPDPNCLTATEAAAGETLACIACPRSSLTIDA
jgi:ferredoxin